MRKDINVITTTGALTAAVKGVLADRGLDYPVHYAVTEDALTIARKAVAAGTKIIVSRGQTTAYLRKFLTIPVVDIRHSFVDIHMTVEKARLYSERIAFVGGDNLCSAARVYQQITGAEIIIVPVDEDFEMGAHQAVRLGAGALAGGLQVKALAEKLGVYHIDGQADPEAINLAIDEALHNLRVEEERQERYETINTILNSASEGIVGIRGDGDIIHINPIARKQLGYRSQKNISELLPPGQYMETARTGEPHYGELIEAGSENLVLNSVPIRVQERVLGAVTTIQKETNISSMDIKIRKKHLSRGHVAKTRFEDIVGSSQRMTALIETAKQYARTQSTVLISGETGTGKEVFAQSIHNYSDRREQPFVAVNCAALAENLLESELFGYVKGAFTGARNEGREGLFELAHNGTVFLDEIGEISTSVQAKLLRVIQEKEVSRIGDDKVIPVNVRIIAASNKDFPAEIARGSFREDLYYRICVLELPLPPLRERKADIPALLDFLLTERCPGLAKAFSPGARDLLSALEWPGNIRQLGNIVERLAVTTRETLINREACEEMVKALGMPGTGRLAAAPPAPAPLTPVQYLTKEELTKAALVQAGGNKKKAAALLGISTTTLWRRMKAMGLQ